MSYLSAAELLNEASERTGLNNFGPDNFREPFEIMVEGINNRPDVLEDRLDILKEEILRLLVNRLWFARDIEENPEILKQELLPPVSIASLPRTGTTKLQRILSATDHFQSTLYWHLIMPARVPGQPDGGVEKRIQRTQQLVDWRAKVIPEMDKIHLLSTFEPEEELFVCDETFRSPYMAFTHTAPEFIDWYHNADMDYTYDYLKMELQYLQWQFNRDAGLPWLLKAPGHLGFEDQLQRVFPKGQKIIFSHRNPVEIMGSLSGLAVVFNSQFYSGKVDRELAGQTAANLAVAPLLAHMEWRKTNTDIEILDLSFKDVTANSLETAEKVYDFIGLELTDDAVRKIRSWDTQNPRHRHGKYEYRLTDFGLTEDYVNKVFEAYLEEFSGYLW